MFYFLRKQKDKRLLKKSKYKKNTLLLKLILSVDNNLENEDKTPTRVNFVEKREIDRSTLYSFNGPFQVVHADVGNLEFFGKNATIPRYVLLVVDLCSSKVYVYPMRSRKQILHKMKLFYDEVKIKENRKKWGFKLTMNSNR